ncbi:MAG: hypothetical protein AAF391_08070, partial [Bacteroidota bacterium]
MGSEKLVYRLSADNKRLQKDLNKAKAQLSRFQGQSKSISAGINKSLTQAFTVGAGLAVAQRGFSELKAFASESLQLYDEQEQAIAQVRAGLESTGFVAGRTLSELKKKAADLQDNTIFGDERILKEATAQLLTFTNIAGINFDRTQKAALDLATRLDGDLKSSSIQLGKALNDPVANLSALSRSGIQFSEDQKKVIKELANTNRLAEAQTIILDELEKQYGGSAEAAAEAGLGGFKQLQNSIGDLKEEIGELLLAGSGEAGL